MTVTCQENNDVVFCFVFCRIDQMFSDSFTKEFQLLSADPKRHLYMACALLLRGSVDVSDVRRNIDK